MSVAVSAAVEGDIDESVLLRLAEENGLNISAIYGKCGKLALLRKLGGYNSAAQFAPWIIFVDLDHEHDCASKAREQWLPQIANGMCFRIAVREIEAWPLADRPRIAEFLGVPARKIPQNPDIVPDPKELIVRLAGQSRRKEIREGMVPRGGSGRRIGPLYTSRMMSFISDKSKGWRPAEASAHSDSLRRCMACLARLHDSSRRAFSN